MGGRNDKIMLFLDKRIDTSDNSLQLLWIQKEISLYKLN